MKLAEKMPKLYVGDLEMSRMCANPVRTLERTIDRICKRETSYAAGLGVRILRALADDILRDREGINRTVAA